LSADAQITKRKILKGSPAFHRLTGAIAAYGKALGLLTALQRREEFYTLIGQYELAERVAAFSVTSLVTRGFAYRSSYAAAKAALEKHHANHVRGVGFSTAQNPQVPESQ
jgi:hypothetical protein